MSKLFQWIAIFCALMVGYLFVDIYYTAMSKGQADTYKILLLLVFIFGTYCWKKLSDQK